jgi:hypothetical protein
MPPKVEPEEEKEKAKERPSYSGDPIQIPANCDPQKLSQLGMICNAASPCEMWLELTAVREAGEGVVAAGDIYSRVNMAEGVVLYSADGGAKWTEAIERIPGAALDEMQFADEEHGWIVGRQYVGGGQQPFLLATEDGGKSWRSWPLDEDEDYRGTVLQLRFDSPEHGFAVLERPAGDGDPYEMRETFNGGRSWSLREVTADRPALPGSRRRAPEPSVRMREESDKDVFVVERRTGDSWEALGRFAGSSGSCGAE